MIKFQRTNKRRASTALFAVLACVSAAAVDAEVTSIADWQCSAWAERRASGERLDAPQMWLSGYLSGLASASGVDALAITDAPQIFAWMDKYCQAYPQAALATGALVLFHDLAARLPQGPAQAL